MNFAPVELTEAQQELLDEVCELLTDNWSPDPTAISLDHERMPTELRHLLADRGWLRPRAPRAEGGAGFGDLEARILELALDAHRVPTGGDTLIVSLVPALEKYGSDELHRDVLPRLRSGHATICLGYSEPDCGSDLGAVRTRAVRQEDGNWLVNGAKMWTSFGQESDFMFLLARTGTFDERKSGLTMFLLPMDVDGIDCRPVPAMGSVRTNVVFLTDVRIPDTHRLGAVGEGWQVLAAPLAAEHGRNEEHDPYGDINGVMGALFTRTLERLVEHVAASEAMEVGEDAVTDIELALAEALMDVELCRGAPGQMGKPLASDAVARHADRLTDLLGPSSVLQDQTAPAAGTVSAARLVAPATAIYGGTTEIYRNNIAVGELGLPRPY